MALHNPFIRQLITCAEAAYIVGYKKNTIKYWIAKGYLKKYGVGRIRVDFEQLAELMTNPPNVWPKRDRKGIGGRPRLSPSGRYAKMKKETTLLDAAIAGMRAEALRKDAEVAKDVGDRPLPVGK